MTRLPLLAAIVAVLGLWSPRADASNCSVDQYDHNGSLMELQLCDGGNLTISYITPRRGMIAEGASSGTQLFEGVQRANGAISGRALLFSSRCGAIVYQVAGSNQGASIVLTGSAPVRDNNCQVVRNRPDRLVFTLRTAGAAPGGPQTVAPSCPAGFVLSGGQCVRSASPVPSCPAGFFLSGGQCVRAGAAAPAPRPVPAGGDWHAIAGSFKSRGEAQARANQLGGGWYVMNTSQCPNFRDGYWIATAGPTGKGQAQAFANQARGHGAYTKTCN